VRILVVNWQDRLNPMAGGAEVHLHEIFSRIGKGGNDVIEPGEQCDSTNLGGATCVTEGFTDGTKLLKLDGPTTGTLEVW